jgi:outer membrane protein assembly factor BamD
MQKKLSKLTTLIFVLSLFGCSTDKVDETKNWPAPKIYSEAREELASGNYERAITLFEKLEAGYPFGTYAQQAQLEIAYAYYKQADQAQALAAVERFIKLHPNHPNVDYMYYLRGLINFNDPTSFLDRFYPQDATERDPKGTREAFDAFKRLVEKFPNSEYAPDARLRMKYLVNAMAQYELHVARYYYRRGAYLSAINRAQTAVTDYRESPATEEALFIMVQGYEKLGLTELHDDTQRIFNKNFPNSAFPSKGQRPARRWWDFW